MPPGGYARRVGRTPRGWETPSAGAMCSRVATARGKLSRTATYLAVTARGKLSRTATYLAVTTRGNCHVLTLISP